MIKVQDVTGLDLAFGGSIKKLLPSYEEIPKEFKKFAGGPKWNSVVSDWFYKGIKGAKWIPKEGIDTNKALKHVQACLTSFEPSHEHKMAGCAYLLSEFFKDVTY